MISLDKREQWLNLAFSQIIEAHGLDHIIDRCKIDQVRLSQIPATEFTNQHKIALLTTQSVSRQAAELRESLLRQGYDNLRCYFGDHEVNQILGDVNDSTVSESTKG